MRNKRMVGLFMAMVLLAAVSLAGCGGKTEAPATNDSGKEGQQKTQEAAESQKIAVLMPSLSGQIYVTLIYGVLDEAKKMGVDQPVVLAAGGYDKLDVQMKQVEDMIAGGADAIIIMPLSMEAVTPALDRAVDAGIKVIEMGNFSNSKKVQARVGPDQFTCGKKIAEAAVKKLNGKGNIVMFNGPAGADWSQLETNGFKSVIKNYPEIKILAEKWTVYDAGVAMNTMNDLLQTFPKIDYIYTAYNTYAEGATSALEVAGKKGKIPMATISLTPAVLEMLKEGSMDYVVGTGDVAVGRLALQTTLKLLKGEQVPPMQNGPVIDYFSDEVKANPNIDTTNDFFPEGWTVPK